MPVRLTDTAITKAIRDAHTGRTRRDLADAGQPGLRLRVTPAGAGTWVLACRDRGGAHEALSAWSIPSGRYIYGT